MRQHRSLTSLAHKTIRDMVLSGEIAPGSRIHIDELRAKLEMGGSPVREALSILSSEQLVLRTEQRGFRAAEISAEDFNTLVQTIRCQASWVHRRANLREYLAHLVGCIMRRVDGDAIGAFQTSFV